MCPYIKSGCLLMCVGMGLAWLLVASFLLQQAWNRVICHVFSQRPAVKYWQTLLLLVCVVVLAAPCAMKKRMGMHGSQCPMKHDSACCDKPNCDEKMKGMHEGHGKDKDCCTKPDCCKESKK